jgi:hypothetical protein
MNKMKPFRVIGERQTEEQNAKIMRRISHQSPNNNKKKESEKEDQYANLWHRLQSSTVRIFRVSNKIELKKKETTFAYQKLDDHNRHVI